MALRLLLLLVAALWGVGAGAQTFPKFTGLVVDAANVLPPQAEADLTVKLDALQRDTKRQLVVATVPDLGGYDIRDYGYRLGREWGVGLRDVNNGLVLLVAPNERKVAIEVGTGLEPIVTDALASTVIRSEITPRFKAGDLPGGVAAGVDALARQLRAGPEEARARLDAAVREFDRTHRRQTRESGGGGAPVSLVFWGFILLFVVLPLLRGRGRTGGRGRRYRSGMDPTLPIVLWSVANEMGRGRGGWGGGGFGGGFGGGSDGSWGGGGFPGGGSGSFSGGGASGDW